MKTNKKPPSTAPTPTTTGKKKPPPAPADKKPDGKPSDGPKFGQPLASVSPNTFEPNPNADATPEQVKSWRDNKQCWNCGGDHRTHKCDKERRDRQPWSAAHQGGVPSPGGSTLKQPTPTGAVQEPATAETPTAEAPTAEVPAADPPIYDSSNSGAATEFPVLCEHPGSRYVPDLGDDELPLQPDELLASLEQPAPSATMGSATTNAAMTHAS